MAVHGLHLAGVQSVLISSPFIEWEVLAGGMSAGFYVKTFGLILHTGQKAAVRDEASC